MFIDATLILSQNQAVTVTAPSTGTIDLTGAGVGVAAPDRIGVQSSVFGEDIGIGNGASPPVITCIVGTTFTAAGAGTMQVQFQEAIDDGTNNPGTWTTATETPALSLAQLVAGTKIAEFTVPVRAPGQAFPRFIRLNYIVATGPMTAGTIAIATINTGRDDVPFYGAGY
jgi:hypothetical protein